jgi:hypothetical protein
VIIRRPAIYLAALATFGLIVATTSGCVAYMPGPALGTGQPAETPTGLDTSDPITAQRAGYVETMLAGSYADGPETQRGFTSVITGYGGGYVTDAKMSGPAGPNTTVTMTVVLGGGSPINSMQGEGDKSPSGIACFTYTLGYYLPQGTDKQVACPSSLTTPVADATAERQIAEQLAAVNYDATIVSKSMPTTPAEAEQVIRLNRPTHASPAPGATARASATAPVGATARFGTTAPAVVTATAEITAADFATGTDSIQHKPDAALALPQTGGGCIYVVYRWIRSSWDDDGDAGSMNSPVAIAWAAPTDDACTGPAALSAGGFLTVDRYAGG